MTLTQHSHVPIARLTIKGNIMEYAFPVSTIDGHTQYGMTLRDYFAAKALLGLLADNKYTNHENIAVYAYGIADYMIEARKS